MTTTLSIEHACSSAAYGEECGIVQDCQYADSDCVDRQCSCRQGYEHDKDSNACVPAQPPGGRRSSLPKSSSRSQPYPFSDF